MKAAAIRALFICDDDLRRLPDLLIEQLSRPLRVRAKALQHVSYTDDMTQMIEDLGSLATLSLNHPERFLRP